MTEKTALRKKEKKSNFYVWRNKDKHMYMNWHIRTYFALNSLSVLLFSVKTIAILITAVISIPMMKNMAINFTFNGLKSSA